MPNTEVIDRLTRIAKKARFASQAAYGTPACALLAELAEEVEAILAEVQGVSVPATTVSGMATKDVRQEAVEFGEREADDGDDGEEPPAETNEDGSDR